VLDAVPARRTTSDLIVLNQRITVPGTTVLAEARAWLAHQGILPRTGLSCPAGSSPQCSFPAAAGHAAMASTSQHERVIGVITILAS
jgi:hypothetical protein